MSSPDPIELEKQGWRALATGGAEAAAFYDEVLADDVVMLLPGGLVLDDRAQILESMSGPPWSTYVLEDLRELRPAPDVAVVHYGVVAQRGSPPPYHALVASTYVRGPDGWRLVLHQQTPR
jgi:hypothetical protein